MLSTAAGFVSAKEMTMARMGVDQRLTDRCGHGPRALQRLLMATGVCV